MAAAYASLVSLLNTMDQIQIHPLLSTSFSEYPNESIRANIDFFLDFLERYSDAESEEAKDLVRRIGAAAHEAEDVIEVQAAYRIRSGFTKRSLVMPRKLKKMIEEMESIKRKIIAMNPQTVSSEEEAEFLVRRMAVVTLSPDPQMKKPNEETGSVMTTKMVGFEGYLEQLLDQLTRQNPGLQILPIVGMGGVGKTTLARNAYENLLTVDHFYVRAWATVSQEFSVREILIQVLSCLGISYDKSETNRTVCKLGEELYKILYGRRYLIVLDDVWSVEAWDKLKCFFPKDNNGSRILITTRQSQLVGYIGSPALAVDFLDDKNSWSLFCEKTFGQEDCPPDLVQIGKNIVDKCKGLPLAIVVIGGFLSKSPRTPEYWEKVAKDKNLILDSNEGNKSLGILNLSYKYLPMWLKACFLYLRLFPEDHRIKVSQLTKLWVAEGFVKPNACQSLEETAENYITELVDRNLVLVGSFRRNKKINTCYIHDLVRDLCMRTTEKENCFYVQRSMDGMSDFVVDERNTTFYPQDSPISIAPSIFHPLVFDRQREMPFKSRLLRVSFGDCAFGEVNLRYLSCRCDELPSSISLLWSLQTLFIHNDSTIIAPREIWKMPQLRHIYMQSVCLPDPVSSDDAFALENLQTLGMVDNLIFSEELCKRMPNVKHLEIRYYPMRSGEAVLCYQMENIRLLNKLESLHFSLQTLDNSSFKNLKLPSSIKELTLLDCKLAWNDIRMIASSPHLRVLKLLEQAVVGEEWDFSEMEFVCLKHLRIEKCYDLSKWNIADKSCFPVLETLSLEFLFKLEEVPQCIGDIPTLESIDLSFCSESAAISAVNILDEQENLGNQVLQLKIKCIDMYNAKKLRGKIEKLGFTCQNLRISQSKRFLLDELVG